MSVKTQFSDAELERMLAFQARFDSLAGDELAIVELAFRQIGRHVCALASIGGDTELHPAVLDVLLVSVYAYMSQHRAAWQDYLAQDVAADIAEMRGKIEAELEYVGLELVSAQTDKARRN